MLSAPGFIPDTPLLLEAIFNFNSHLYSGLPTPFGRWGSGQMKLEKLTDVHGQMRYRLGRWRQDNSGVQVLLLRKFQPIVGYLNKKKLRY